MVLDMAIVMGAGGLAASGGLAGLWCARRKYWGICFGISFLRYWRLC